MTWGRNSGDDYNTGDDATIDANQVLFNYGATTTLLVDRSSGGEKEALVKMDVSALSSLIASSTQIISATLKVYAYSRNITNTVQVYRLKRLWNEGNKNGAEASTGEVTWNSARHNQLNWTTPGALNVNDKDTTPSDSTSITGVNQYFDWDVTQDIKDFFDGSETNYGWILRNANNGNFTWFVSSEGANNTRPYLEIQFYETSLSSSSSSSSLSSSSSSSSSSLSSSSSSSSSSVSSSSSSSSLSSSSSSSSLSSSSSSSSSSLSSSSSSSSSSFSSSSSSSSLSSSSSSSSSSLSSSSSSSSLSSSSSSSSLSSSSSSSSSSLSSSSSSESSSSSSSLSSSSSSESSSSKSSSSSSSTIFAGRRQFISENKAYYFEAEASGPDYLQVTANRKYFFTTIQKSYQFITIDVPYYISTGEED